jgi:hypothetical protein
MYAPSEPELVALAMLFNYLQTHDHTEAVFVTGSITDRLGIEVQTNGFWSKEDFGGLKYTVFALCGWQRHKMNCYYMVTRFWRCEWHYDVENQREKADYPIIIEGNREMFERDMIYAKMALS